MTSGNETAFIDSSWTHGLTVHPVGEFSMNHTTNLKLSVFCLMNYLFSSLCAATVATFFAFFFALSLKPIIALISALVALLATILTLTAFVINITVFLLVKDEFDKLNAGITTKTGPGSSTPFFQSQNFHLLFSFAFVYNKRDRVLVDLCFPCASSHRNFHCMFFMVQSQEAAALGCSNSRWQ